MSGPGCMNAGTGWKGQVLEAPNLRLRRLTAADAPALVALAGDADVSRTTAHLPHPFGGEEAQAFLDRARVGGASGRELIFAVERRIQPGLIGCAGIVFPDAGSGGETAIGYWIGKPHWGHGYATEAVQALVRLLFGNFDAATVTAEVMGENPASGRVLEKAGFTRTGTGVGGTCQGRCAGKPIVTYRLRGEDWRAREAAKPILLVAAAALLDADGRVLIAQRPEGKSLAGLWEFPGGKVHDGETPEAALVRELHEELGIDITESCLAPLTFASHAYESFHLLMPLYVCRTWKGAVTGREGQALKWVRPARLADEPMPPADIPLVPLIRDFL